MEDEFDLHSVGFFEELVELICAGRLLYGIVLDFVVGIFFFFELDTRVGQLLDLGLLFNLDLQLFFMFIIGWKRFFVDHLLIKSLNSS